MTDPTLKREPIRAASHRSLRAIAAALTARGIRTRRGGSWRVGNVKALLARVDKTGDHDDQLYARNGGQPMTPARRRLKGSG